jgi:hypothetical protein
LNGLILPAPPRRDKKAVGISGRGDAVERAEHAGGAALEDVGADVGVTNALAAAGEWCGTRRAVG